MATTVSTCDDILIGSEKLISALANQLHLKHGLDVWAKRNGGHSSKSPHGWRLTVRLKDKRQADRYVQLYLNFLKEMES